MQCPRLIPTFIILLASMFSTAYAGDSSFPGRSQYPDIPVISSAELKADFAKYIVIDARSAFEYSTLRIKNAVNIPIANKTFETELLSQANLAKQKNKKIAFYCNGRSCFKSYRAVKVALSLGIENSVAYDAGVFEWTETYPALAVLLGVSPVNTKHLISKDKFKNHSLDPDSFSEQLVAQQGNAIVLDIRDKYQRAGVGFFPGIERWTSLDNTKKLERYLNQAKKQGKTLFIYDEVGKQVRWLQYALEKAGIEKYFFMDNGAKGYYAMLNTHRLN